MKRLGTLLLVAGMSVAMIQTGHAAAVNNETVQSTLSTMSSLRGNLVSLQGELDGLLVVNTRLNEENVLWQEQLDTRLQPLFDVHYEKSREHVDEEVRLTAIIDRHNRGCNGTVEQATYDRCKGEEPYIKQASDEYYAVKSVLQTERASLTAEWDSYANLITANSEKMNANFNRHLEIQDNYGEILVRLENLRGRLVDLCVDADTDRDGEAIHHCNSVAWDGANRNLPTLDEILNGTEFFSD